MEKLIKLPANEEIVLPVSEELVNYLSGINRDLVGRKMVIKKILSSMNVNMINQLEVYEKEYLQKYGEYEIAKTEALDAIITESGKDIGYDKNTTDANWSINFYDRTLEMRILNKNKLKEVGKVDKDIIEELRIKTIEITAMQEVISEYVSESYDILTPTYMKYFENFTIENEKYERLKQEVAKKFGIENVQWKIDFDSETIYQIL